MSRDIHAILLKHWGFPAFRDNQEEIIQSVLSGKDTLAMLPTGGGKSICFQVPALASDGICLVVSPLIALMKDQVENLKKRDIQACLIYSGLTRREVLNELDNCRNGKYKFLYISPERLCNPDFRDDLRSLDIQLIAVDEAHCISQWGYDFRPEYLRIGEIRKHISCPIIALTASATTAVAEDIMLRLGFNGKHVFRSSFHRPNLSYLVLHTRDKLTRIKQILQKIKGSGLIYVRSRKRTLEISETLNQLGFTTTHYHAGSPNEEKIRKLNEWQSGSMPVIVCTNAFGMGIDKPDVRIVIHYELPDSLESYYQEAGRAGRDGKDSFCVMLWDELDGEEARKKLTESFPEQEEIERIYQALGNYCNIAPGSGLGTDHPFMMQDFCEKFSLKPLRVMKVLEILHRHELLLLNEALFSPSRFRILLSNTELYKFQVEHISFDPFIKLVLRTYGGMVFDHYVNIDEHLLAQRAKLNATKITDYLQKLDQLKVIDFVKKSHEPRISWLQNRNTHSGIEYKQLQAQLKVNMDRLNALIQFCDDKLSCRSRMLLSYFNEIDPQPCGKCDFCRLQVKNAHKLSNFDRIKAGIKEKIQSQDTTVKDLIAHCEFEEEQNLLKVLRFLMDEGILSTDKNQRLKWKG